LIDLRNPDSAALSTMLAESQTFAEQAAAKRTCDVTTEPIWQIEPIPFDPDLVALALDAVKSAGGGQQPMTSGALHDAAEVARVLPAAMLFVPSIGGISHAKEEDTSEAHLATGIEAFGRFANAALSRG
jgi:N-carbamoyl-L-amino-acid hydrolase